MRSIMFDIELAVKNTLSGADAAVGDASGVAVILVGVVAVWAMVPVVKRSVGL